MAPIIYRISILCCCLGFIVSSVAKPENKPHPIDINIQGVTGLALKNAYTQLTLKKNLITPSQPDTVRLHFYDSIPQDVKEALQPYGYFKATVTTTLKKRKGALHIFVNVKPGPRLKFTKVTVTIIGEGQKSRPFKRYLHRLPIKPGDYFDSEKYEAIKNMLQVIANNRGYFNAKFITSKLIIDLKHYTSTVLIQYDTGARFHFGETHFSPSPIKKSLLKRYLLYLPGDYYWDRTLEKTRINLTNSPYFTQVVMTPEIKQAKNLWVPIDVKLYSEDQVVYSFGAGYGTDTGVRGLASMDLHFVNPAGHTMKVVLRGSQLNNEFATTYTIPGPNPARDIFSITGGLLEINQVTGQGKSAQLGASYQTRVLGWQVVASLNYLAEKYHLNNYPVSGVTTNTNATLLYPTISLQKTVARENFINPTRGFNISFTASAGSEYVGSKTSFSQYRFDSIFLYTIDFTHTRVLTRLSFGATDIASLQNLPLSMQFFAGGASSIRGFEYNSIGPGRYLAVGSFELQQRIVGNFYLAGFIDAGNVSNNVFRDKPYIGSGPAFVYLTPIGPLEISVAKALSPVPNGWSFQFSMGALL